MTINYICRHCGSEMGRIHNDEVSEYRLGFHFLTPEERSDIITYNNSSGDVTVKLTCIFCEQALEANPELNMVTNPLQ